MEEYRNLIVPFDTGENPGEGERRATAGLEREKTIRSKNGVETTRSSAEGSRGLSSHLFQRADFIVDRISRYLSPKREILLPHEPRCFRSPIHRRSGSRAICRLGKYKTAKRPEVIA